MNNSTFLPENDGPLNSPGFVAYIIILAVVTLVAGMMMGFAILALLKATSIPGPLRLFLINLLSALIVVALAVMFIAGTSVVLVAVGSNQPRPQYLCRVYLWVFATGIVTRLWSLAAFALSTLAIVRFGKKTISKWSATVIILALWLAPMVLTLYILLPYVYEEQFIYGVACFSDNNRTVIPAARFTFLVSWTIFGGITPLTVSIIVPIVCLCYIRKNTVTEGAQYRKGLAKFSLFLVVGGGINLAGQIIPLLFTLNSAAPGVYLTYGSVVISLLPTPIIIMAFLKPVREQAKEIITCGQLSKQSKEPQRTTSSSSDGNAIDVE